MTTRVVFILANFENWNVSARSRIRIYGPNGELVTELNGSEETMAPYPASGGAFYATWT